MRQCSGQPCQKHESMKTAIFLDGNKMSGLPRSELLTRYLSPADHNFRRRDSSSFVLLDLTRRMTSERDRSVDLVDFDPRLVIADGLEYCVNRERLQVSWRLESEALANLGNFLYDRKL